MPEKRLLCALIKSAIDDHDYAWFDTYDWEWGTFRYCCDSLGIDPELTLMRADVVLLRKQMREARQERLSFH